MSWFGWGRKPQAPPEVSPAYVVLPPVGDEGACPVEVVRCMRTATKTSVQALMEVGDLREEMEELRLRVEQAEAQQSVDTGMSALWTGLTILGGVGALYALFKRQDLHAEVLEKQGKRLAAAERELDAVKALIEDEAFAARVSEITREAGLRAAASRDEELADLQREVRKLSTELRSRPTADALADLLRRIAQLEARLHPPASTPTP